MPALEPALAVNMHMVPFLFYLCAAFPWHGRPSAHKLCQSLRATSHSFSTCIALASHTSATSRPLPARQPQLPQAMRAIVPPSTCIINVLCCPYRSLQHQRVRFQFKAINDQGSQLLWGVLSCCATHARFRHRGEFTLKMRICDTHTCSYITIQG